MVTRNYNWGVELTRQGHDVTIVASSYSHYRNKHPDMGDQCLKREMIDGIRYLWLRGDIYDGNSGFGRIKSMFTFHRRLLAVTNRIGADYDLVIASSPQPFVIYPARAIARKNNAKLIYDIRDLWPLTLKEIGGMSKWHPFIMALQHAEDYACRHADLVTAVPQNCKDYLVDHGMDADKFLHIGNGAIIQEIVTNRSLPDAHSSRITRLKEDGKFLIGYAGTLGRANALHAPIKALKTANKNIHFVIIGRGNEEAKLRQYVADQNLQDRVDFLPPVEQNQVPHFLKLIDVAYIGLTDSPLFQYGASPAKITIIWWHKNQFYTPLVTQITASSNRARASVAAQRTAHQFHRR